MDNTAGRPTQSIAITVKIFGGLRQELATPEWRVDLATGAGLSALLDLLRSDEPALGARLDEGLAKGYLNILINGRNARFLDQMETRLNDGDVVAFLPPVGGG